MVDIGAQQDRGFVSRGEFIEGTAQQPSFFLSPPPSDPGGSLTDTLERAFGSKSSFSFKLMSMEAPDKAYVQRYLLQMHRRSFKPLTITQGFITLRRFLASLTTTGKRHVGEVKRSDLEVFVEGEQDRGHKLSTVQTSLARIYAFLPFLVEQELIPADILVRRVKLRVPERLPRAMDPDDVRRLLSVIADTGHRAMFMLIVRCGLRVEEMAELSLADIDLRRARTSVQQGKGPKARWYMRAVIPTKPLWPM